MQKNADRRQVSVPDRTFLGKLYFQGVTQEITVLVFDRYYVVDPSTCCITPEQKDKCRNLTTLDGKQYCCLTPSYIRDCWTLEMH